MIATERVAVIPLGASVVIGLVLWARGLPHDWKYRTGVFRWRD